MNTNSGNDQNETSFEVEDGQLVLGAFFGLGSDESEEKEDPPQKKIIPPTEVFNSLADQISKSTEGFISKIGEAVQPSEITLEIGVGIDTKTKLFLLEAGAKADVRVKLQWKIEGTSSQGK